MTDPGLRVAPEVYAAQLASEAIILHLDTKRIVGLSTAALEVDRLVERLREARLVE